MYQFKTNRERNNTKTRRFLMGRAPSFLFTPFWLFLLALVLLAGTAYAGWERTYDWGRSTDDEAWCVQQTSDGGYIVFGWGQRFNMAYLIKTGANGNKLWDRAYDPGGRGNTTGRSAVQTPDGGYALAGYTATFSNGFDVFVVKTDTSGHDVWSRTYGGPFNDLGTGLRKTSDGSFIVSEQRGRSGGYAAGLLKLNASGDSTWERLWDFGGPNSWGGSCWQTADGGCVLAGTVEYNRNFRAFLSKTDASGNILWTQEYDPGYNGIIRCYAVKQTADGGYILGGHTYPPGVSAPEYWALKTDSSGNAQWEKTYGGSDTDYGWDILQTSDGGYAMVGESWSNSTHGECDVWLVRTDASGDILWTSAYGGSYGDAGHSIQRTADTCYVIAGLSNSFGAGDWDMYLIKTDPDVSGVEEGKAVRPLVSQTLKVFPNPMVSFAAVQGHERERFSLYDISGRKVGTYQGDRIGEGLSPGVYFLKPESQAGKPIRIVKVR